MHAELPPRVKIEENKTPSNQFTPANSSMSPRVHIMPCDEDEVDTLPRVSIHDTKNTPIITVKTLQHHSNLLRNLRFIKQTAHKHTLSSNSPYLTPPDLIAQQIFDLQFTINHI